MDRASTPQADSSMDGQFILGVGCACRIIHWRDPGHDIRACPLHAAASELLATLEGEHAALGCATCETCGLIAKAKGQAS